MAFYEIFGANGSPYSQKMLTYMRYKRLPVLWRKTSQADALGGEKGAVDSGPQFGTWPKRFAHLRPAVIPVMVFPDGGIMHESTAVLLHLEKQHPSRPALPRDPGLRFLAMLLEDFADEWVTKCMYGFRWNTKRDAEHAAQLLAVDAVTPLAADAVDAIAAFVLDKQRGRTEIVGCPDSTIHPTFHRLCSALEKCFTGTDEEPATPFIFGDLPSVADFALFGQMSQFLIDLTPTQLLPEKYKRVAAWLWRMQDTSGVETTGAQERLSSGCRELLKLCAESYLPFLQANARAVAAGEKIVTLPIFGGSVTHSQRPFKWQVQCYKTLQKLLADAPAESAPDLHQCLKETGCLEFLSPLQAAL